MKRGRKSATDGQPASQHAVLTLHLPPPAKLTADQRKLWIDTVRSRPVEWFRPEHEPMLVAYVRAVSLADQLAIKVQRCKDPKELLALQRSVESVNRNIVTFARTMRLTHRSISNSKALTASQATRADTGISVQKRPWEH